MKYIKIDEIKNTDELARDIITDSGQILLKAGITLNRSYIKILIRYEIETISILEENEEPKGQLTKEKRIELKKDIKPHKKEIFKNALIDEFMEELLYEIIENAVVEKWYHD